MYDIVVEGTQNEYECNELIKVFLKPSEYRLVLSGGAGPGKIELLRDLYKKLSGMTGKCPEWGVLTGVRPVKLAGELMVKYGDAQTVRNILTNEYLLNDKKADLLVNIYEYQQAVLKSQGNGKISVYIGIPFCPTRCLYCSFTSNQAADSKVSEYMDALFKEMEYAGNETRKKGLLPETLYIGGGTPTVLSPELLEKLLKNASKLFDLSELLEFTVEAGRPDTLTGEKLKIIKTAGVSRISINPQSAHEKTLKLIGRSHTFKKTEEAFLLARAEGIDIINMDVIAGLPEETPEDFAETVKAVTEFAPENITVHTLAVKRASKLNEIDKDYHYRQGYNVREMLYRGKEILKDKGYTPYYLYRQKHMAGGFENTGWCLDGTEGVYNIRIMEEKQTILALGAGGITKVYYPGDNRIERIPNVTNYEQYMSRIDEMIERKKENLFREGKKNVDKRA